MFYLKFINSLYCVTQYKWFRLKPIWIFLRPILNGKCSKLLLMPVPHWNIWNARSTVNYWSALSSREQAKSWLVWSFLIHGSTSSGEHPLFHVLVAELLLRRLMTLTLTWQWIIRHSVHSYFPTIWSSLPGLAPSRNVVLVLVVLVADWLGIMIFRKCSSVLTFTCLCSLLTVSASLNGRWAAPYAIDVTIKT